MENKFDTVICLRMGKTNTAKTPPSDFQVTTPEIPLLSQQAITDKGIPVPYTNLQLNSNPNTNWTCSMVIISLFDAWLPSTRLTNCADPSTQFQLPTREGCWLQGFSVHFNDEDQKDAWSQNPTMHKHNNFFKNDELGQILSSVTICLNKLCSTLVQLVNTLTTLKIILLYV